jgi:hypothetical protein
MLGLPKEASSQGMKRLFQDNNALAQPRPSSYYRLWLMLYDFQP